MEVLKEWVRGLVMLVILATCLEMMLPMNAMKKYVRMTMGLLVVLAVIQPVLGFMRQTVTVTNLFPDEDAGNLPTISQIMNRAEQFRAKNQTLALTEARTRLTREAVQAARGVKGVADARADLLLAEEQGEYRVRSVTVTVAPGTGGGAGPGGSGAAAVRPGGSGTAVDRPGGSGAAVVRPVKPVAPVRPGTDPAATPATAGNPVEQPPPARPPTAAEQALTDSVGREIAARLGLPAAGVVTVLIEGR